MGVADSYLCRDCSKVISATKNNRYRTHMDKDGERCEASSADIPPDLLEQGPEDPKASPEVPVKGKDYETCPHCRKNVKLTRLGYFAPHSETLYGAKRCLNGGVRFRPLKRVEDVPLPGDGLPKKGVYVQQVPDDAHLALPPGSGDRTEPPSPSAAEGPTESVASDLFEREPGAKEAATFLQQTTCVSEKGSTPTASEPEVSPGTSTGSGGVASATPSSTSPSMGSTTTSKPSRPPATDPLPTGPFSLGTAYSGRFLQPFSPFLQPGEIPERVTTQDAMNDRGKEIANRLKEVFYAYSNRRTSDNRSAQTTLGPSEIGTPCDRRLAMALMGIEPVNPGGDGWAAFVGTCVHAGLDDMFSWASANTGRFVTEMKLQFGSELVPRGTGDLLDRTLFMFLDHKLMGQYSLKKLKEKGPGDTYRVQIHTYAYGAVLAGEKVRDVAIVGWPRAGSSLDDLFVWTEPYDRKVAEEALRRVERINKESVQMGSTGGVSSKMRIAQSFVAGDDCRYCQFHLRGDKGFTRGCPGK